MTTNSPILGFPLVQPNQTQKEDTIGTAQTVLEAAEEDFLSISFSGGNVTATATQWTTSKTIIFTGATAARTLTVPATKRHVVFRNKSTFPITVQVTGGTGIKVAVQGGQTMFASCDGVDLQSISTNGYGVPVVFTADHNLVAADFGGMIDLNKATAIHLLIDPNSTSNCPLGVPIPIRQKAAGQVTVSSTQTYVNIIIASSGTHRTTRAQGSIIWLMQTSIDNWVLYGDNG